MSNILTFIFSVQIKKLFLEFFNFLGVGVRFILLIPKTVSKHKIPLPPSKVFAILNMVTYLSMAKRHAAITDL